MNPPAPDQTDILAANERLTAEGREWRMANGEW